MIYFREFAKKKALRLYSKQFGFGFFCLGFVLFLILGGVVVLFCFVFEKRFFCVALAWSSLCRPGWPQIHRDPTDCHPSKNVSYSAVILNIFRNISRVFCISTFIKCVFPELENTLSFMTQ